MAVTGSTGVGIDVSKKLAGALRLLLVGVLFGLAMDHEVFLVSWTREDFVHSGSARRRPSPELGTAPEW